MSHQQSFSYKGMGLPGLNQDVLSKLGLMCLAQGHNAVMPVRLEPLAPRSRVKHSATEPLHSQEYMHLISISLYIQNGDANGLL